MTRRPDTSRRRALARAALLWGTVAVVVRGKVARLWVTASRQEPPPDPRYRA